VLYDVYIYIYIYVVRRLKVNRVAFSAYEPCLALVVANGVA
jgi:hypothetical protein